MTEDIYKYQGIKANFHTHTTRCNHAQGEDREYVEAAIKQGYKVLGFSDHVPYPFPDGHISIMRMRLEETEGYVNSILKLKQEYEKDIKILLGFETEYWPELFDGLLQHLSQFPVDYMILGQHFLDKEDYEKATGTPRDDETFLKKYLEQVLEGARTGYFSYIAHPDIINYTGNKEIYYKEIKNFAEQLKKLRIPLEINALGLKNKRHYPSKKFFDIIAEVGNDCVLGVDAHSPEALLDEVSYERCMEFAMERNLTILNRTQG